MTPFILVGALVLLIVGAVVVYRFMSPQPVSPGPAQAGVAATQSNHVAQIDDALQELLRTGNEGGFVIVEIAGTEQFVQFAGSAGEPILLDFPVINLSADEQGRADALFGSIPGVKKTEDGFTVDFGTDTNAAARLGARVLAEVHGAGADATLSISAGE